MKAPWWLLVCAFSATAAASTTEGRMVVRDHGKTVDVPLEHTDVKIRVDGFLADATVTQKFVNPYADKIEAVYLFPLPVTAAVSELAITTGGRTIKGAIAERAVEWSAPVPPKTIVEELVPDLLDNIEAAALAVDDGPRTNPGTWCDRCSYRSLCPASREQRYEPVEYYEDDED